MLEIDGSYLEGGGQIIRTSVALSAITAKPIRITNIRKGRDNPGLMTQHIEAVNALAQLCNAEIKGLEKGSTILEFHPREINARTIDITISTAGSVALVLQGLMFAALHADNTIEINVKGGATSGKWAAPANFVKNVLLPILEKMNYKAQLNVLKYGYYPKGGSEILMSITPTELKSINLLERSKLIRIKGISHASSLLKSKNVAERMRSSAENLLKKEGFESDIEIRYVDTICHGCGIELFATYENTILGSDGLGELQRSAESVGKEAAEKLIQYHKSNACMDPHVTDQILPYIAIAAKNGESKISVSEITNHCKTNIWVIEKFLPVKFSIKDNVIECRKI